MIGLFKTIFNGVAEQIEVQEAARRLEAGALMLDVREPAEYTYSHVPSAMLLSLGRIRTFGSAAVDKLGLPPETTDILLICESGMRSKIAQEILSADMRRRYINVAGGIAAWIAQGLPLFQKQLTR